MIVDASEWDAAAELHDPIGGLLRYAAAALVEKGELAEKVARCRALDLDIFTRIVF